MAFKDYSEIVESLTLPINGKNYSIPPVGIADGVRLQAIFDPDTASEMTDDEFRTILLGDAYDLMLADNIPGNAVARATFTALADFQRGRATAEIMWETGGDPKALEAWTAANTNRAQRRSASTAVESKTPKAASTSGTKKSPATP
jgi:hypothetical protein